MSISTPRLHLTVRRSLKATSTTSLFDVNIGALFTRTTSALAVALALVGLNLQQVDAAVTGVTSASATGFNVTSVTIAGTSYSGANLIGSTASIVRDTVSGGAGIAIVGWVVGTTPQLTSSQIDADAASSGLNYRSGALNVLAGSAFQFGQAIKLDDRIFIMDFGTGDAFTAQLIDSTGAALGSTLSIVATSFGGSLFSWSGGINIIGTNNTVGLSATSLETGVSFQLSDFGSGITTATGIRLTASGGLDPVIVGLGTSSIPEPSSYAAIFGALILAGALTARKPRS